jgi:aminodeoxyfutalosine deaminase
MPDPHQSIDFNKASTWTIRAKAVVDAAGCSFAPGQITVAADPDSAGNPVNLCTIAVGPTNEAAPAPLIDLSDSVLVPGFVNAHCHLDLTDIGPRPRPETGGFSAWLEVIRRSRPQDSAAIEAAVRRGINLSLAGGVVAVGDIAGAVRTGPSLTAWRTLRDSPIGGVSFLEFFAMGKTRERSLERLAECLVDAGADRFMLGLEPHAPYSVSRPAYERALALAEKFDLPLATHLAETLDERLFTTTASGPQHAFLEDLGIWDPDESRHLGAHPVEHLGSLLLRRSWLLAHVNDCPDAALDLLAATSCSVAYCPRAHTYFDNGSTLGPHRYQAMLDRGINVCLGTDSIVNLGDEAANMRTGSLTPLTDARLLHRRDATDPAVLLTMLTINGARALGLDKTAFTFTPGRPLAGLVAVDVPSNPANPLEAVFAVDSPPRLLGLCRAGAGI